MTFEIEIGIQLEFGKDKEVFVWLLVSMDWVEAEVMDDEVANL